MLSAIGEGQRVARALNPATVMAALAVLVFLYAIHWILLPFIFAGVVAYQSVVEIVVRGSITSGTNRIGLTNPRWIAASPPYGAHGLVGVVGPAAG
jgi:hypothetical protein